MIDVIEQEKQSERKMTKIKKNTKNMTEIARQKKSNHPVSVTAKTTELWATKLESIKTFLSHLSFLL